MSVNEFKYEIINQDFRFSWEQSDIFRLFSPRENLKPNKSYSNSTSFRHSQSPVRL